MWKVGKEREPTVVCSLVKSPVIYLEPIAKAEITLLMEEYRSQEWLAYLKGRVSEETTNIFIEELSVPPHKEASGASAEAEPFHIPDDCVGIIHSHHTMGAFHSGVDQDYVDKNFPVSITVARDNGKGLTFDAVSYRKTPCGKGVALKCTVKLVQPQPLFDRDTFLNLAKENIDKGKKVFKAVKYFEDKNFPSIREQLPHKNLPYSGYTDYVIDENGKVLGKDEIRHLL